ncbi:hypothetical protein NC653_029766 [Populus alba x Populus x berolinensis]|uniref:GB1/RHD3-type G domain-containing protein n=1 Tax=Populus alba x Populus x berolinensis TaxID=444605 RepID=A0AAD6M379_9ROSI|nr:hypothetical protein NC653_029766 [Populus alba x Populus x berolinensis]
MAGDCCRFQLISGDGVLNMQGLENFTRTTNLSQRGLSYAVVAITGPQSGGRSTLLNKLFQTNFRMMDAEEGRWRYVTALPSYELEEEKFKDKTGPEPKFRKKLITYDNVDCESADDSAHNLSNDNVDCESADDLADDTVDDCDNE